MSWRLNLSKLAAESWKYQSDFILLAAELHDAEFRTKHHCKCKRKMIASNGLLYCEAMQKARIRNKRFRKEMTEMILTSPFLVRGLAPIDNLRDGKE